MAAVNLTEKQIELIFENKWKMKQVDIAKLVGCTPACVNKRIKSGKVVEGYFNIDNLKKYYAV